MKTLLIADDDLTFIQALARALPRHQLDLHVETVGSGLEALTVFESMAVDLLLTDLQMPGMDGFELLAWVSRERPHVPVVVMTAFGSPEVALHLSRLGVGAYIGKPLDLDELRKRLTEALSSGFHGFGRKVTLSSFLHVLYMEAKTCTLQCESRGRRGQLWLRDGKLAHAAFGDQTGESAAFQMLEWDETAIEIQEGCPAGAPLSLRLDAILLEALRRRDEAR